MDAITLLKNDHRSVEKLFKAYEKAGDNAHKTKRRLVDSMIEELSVHAAIEEQVFYPAARKEVPQSTSEVLEALEEHHVVKWQLSELERLNTSDERFDAKVTVLMENVRHHVKEEEGEFFPEVRAALSRKRLSEIGDALESAKKRAPKRPHPKSPSEPPLNVLAGNVAGVIDRAVGALQKA